MSAETLDTIAALREVGGFLIVFVMPYAVSFCIFNKMFGTEQSSW